MTLEIENTRTENYNIPAGATILSSFTRFTILLRQRLYLLHATTFIYSTHKAIYS